MIKQKIERPNQIRPILKHYQLFQSILAIQEGTVRLKSA